MQLSIHVDEEQEQAEQAKDGEEFEDFKPTDNLHEELRTPQMERDDDFAAQVTAGME